jgi:probable phosphoglycerate mutase
LIRHAQSEHHTQGLIGGWSDWELSALGHRQARCLASCLKDEYGGMPCTLACSDLKRAIQTAEAIGQALDVTPCPMPELREHSSGVVDGLPEAEARQHFIAPTKPLADWTAYPGAESWRQVYARVVPCVERLMEDDRPTQEVVLIVSHKIPIHLALCWWLGIGLDSQVWFDVDPASITVLRAEPWGGRTVKRLNDTAHLAVAGIEG